MTDQTEREALTKAFGVSNGTQAWVEFQGGPDEMLATLHRAGFHRTPTPHVVTTVDGLRDLDPEKVPAFVTARGNVMETRTIRWHSDEILADQVLPATPLVPMQDTSEPTADDGYVSRNVYDYDEPEPSADVREALTWGDRDLTAKWGRASEAARKSEHHFPADCLAEAVEVYNFLCGRLNEARTPTPHVVTTGAGLALELSQGDTSDLMLALSSFVKGVINDVYADCNDDDPGVLASNIAQALEQRLATVLTPAPAPVDRDAVVEAMAREWVASSPTSNGGFDSMSQRRQGPVLLRMRAVLDAIEGVSRG